MKYTQITCHLPLYRSYKDPKHEVTTVLSLRKVDLGKTTGGPDKEYYLIYLIVYRLLLAMK